MRALLLVALAACSGSPGSPLTASDPPAAAGALAPNLVTAGDEVLATWLEPVGDDAHRLQLARWRGDGWTAPVTVVESAAIVASWADVPAIARGGDGALVASWAEAQGGEEHGYDVVLARSTDDGATWQRLGPVHRDGVAAEHGFVSLVPEDRGVRVFWLDGRATALGGATALRTARVDATIGPEEVLDERVCDCCATGATAGAVVYRDRSADEVRDIALVERRGDRWAPAPLPADGWRIDGCPVNGPAIDGGTIAWYTDAGDVDRVRLAWRGSPEPAGPIEPIEIDAPRGERRPLGRVDVAGDDEGATVLWMAGARDEAELLLRRVDRRGAPGSELRVATVSAARRAGVPRLARLGDRLLVVWTESSTPTRLRAAHLPIAAVGARSTR